MTPQERRDLIRQAMHDLRVNPYDETTRLMLADFLEGDEGEGGESGAKAAGVFRSGLIVPALLDAGLLCLLLDLKKNTSAYYSQLRGYVRSLELNTLDSVSPPEYDWIWELGVRYKDYLAAYREENGLLIPVVTDRMNMAVSIPRVNVCVPRQDIYNEACDVADGKRLLEEKAELEREAYKQRKKQKRKRKRRRASDS